MFMLSAAARIFTVFYMLKYAFVDVCTNWFYLVNAAYFLLLPVLWAVYTAFFPRRPFIGALLCFGGAAYDLLDLINITGLLAGESFAFEFSAVSVCLIAEYTAFSLIGLCIIGALRSRTAAVTSLVLAFELALYYFVKNAVVYSGAPVILWFYLIYMIGVIAFDIAMIALFAKYAVDEYKKTPPVWLCILLSIVTLGAYAFVWLLRLLYRCYFEKDEESF